MSDGLQLGQIFQGKYIIEREVGRGSFGAVYLAREEGRPEPLAIKVLLPWVREDKETRHRFRREAKLATHLTNAHNVRVFDFGETDDGDLYIVMEFLEGLPLDQVLAEEGILPPERVERIVRQTLISLGEAHQLGIIHRDLKPPNIFICTTPEGDDLVKVFDYGIAKIVGGEHPGSLKETTKLTVRGGLVGTPVYMSPEQCRGEPLTGASDLYSLGIVMYELLTGDVPFEHANPVQVMIMHNNAEVPPLPNSLQESLLGRVMRRALQKDVTKRFRTAEEFREALEGLLNLDEISSTRETTADTPESAYRATEILPPLEPGSLSGEVNGDGYFEPSSQERPGVQTGQSEPNAAHIPIWVWFLVAGFVLMFGLVVVLGFLVIQKL